MLVLLEELEDLAPLVNLEAEDSQERTVNPEDVETQQVQEEMPLTAHAHLAMLLLHAHAKH
ncbi:hypothetical protein TELCIR_24925, partial [Teladorsagia circumcincta]